MPVNGEDAVVRRMRYGCWNEVDEKKKEKRENLRREESEGGRARQS